MANVLAVGVDTQLTRWLQQRVEHLTVRSVDFPQALEALGQDHYSLLLADQDSPNVETAELLEAIRQRFPATLLAIVFCLERKVESSIQHSLIERYNVSQLFYKPVDREELARLIAELLDLPFSLIAPGHRPEQDLAVAAIAKLWEKFRPTIMARVDVCEEAALALVEGCLGEELRKKAAGEAHKLAGSVGSFGYAEGTRLARGLEHLFQGNKPIEPSRGLQTAETVLLLRKTLGREPSAPPLSLTNGAVEDPLLMIIDHDKEVVDQLLVTATEQGLRTTVAFSVAEARGKLAQDRPSVVVLDLTFPGGSGDSLKLVEELSSESSGIPVLVFTRKDSFIDRVEVARCGARGFLQKPLPAGEVMDFVNRLIESERAARPTILAVDDDLQVLQLLQTILKPSGFNLQILEDPLRFWEVLESISPDLLILDIKMPHIGGIELCRVVRNDARWARLPILFLTAHTDLETVQRVFNAGADDFVGKPIVGPELLMRIRNRLERVQLYRSMAETDLLTGVANRGRSVQMLTQFLRFSDRHGQPVSLAILDLDNFKEINDSLGHATGDEVLRRFGKRLLKTFRSEDVVSRWGGEEFVVGMYGMRREDGVQRTADLLEAFRAETFAGWEGRECHVTFSAGVAQYPEDGNDLQAVYKAADRALYAAKAAGKDRIMTAGSHPV
jgi:diguanylate cyclase (GGDEF)-like protein